MKSLLAIAVAGVFLIPAAHGQQGDAPVASAHLSPPNGDPGITADLMFVDNGKSLQVFGQGRGFNPLKHYHTLIYDANAQPSGPRACVPSGTAAVPLSTDQMQVAAWQPIGSTTRTLQGLRKGPAYVPLSSIGAVSVRRHDQTGPNVLLVLQSCGDVVSR
jgi:hypothetical protein